MGDLSHSSHNLFFKGNKMSFNSKQEDEYSFSKNKIDLSDRKNPAQSKILPSYMEQNSKDNFL